MKICKKLVLGFTMCLALISVVNVDARANEPIDVDAKGSITAEYKYDDNPLADVNFRVYRVASVSEDEVYTPIAPFDESEIDFNQLEEQEDWQIAIANLDSGIELGEFAADYEVQTDENGSFVLSNLPTGMYFIKIDSVIYNEQISSSESILYPLQVYDGDTFTWNYDLKIVPKVEFSDIPDEPDEPTTPEPPKKPEPKPDKELPQTGSLEWLVPILTSMGLILLLAGVFFRRKGEEDEA